ncbi:MAG: cold-shock protein [Ilumatobacteraceae bacterium]
MGPELLHGIVESFDAHRGLGVIDVEGEKYLFHCAEISDGTRDIAVNTPVSFMAVQRFGNREASVVTAQVAGNP